MIDSKPTAPVNSLTTNLAYRYVAVALMLAHVNLFCAKVGVPIPQPITESDLRPGGHVGSPNLGEQTLSGNFSGSILTDGYFFGFGRGRLANFKKRSDSATDEDVARRNVALSGLTSLVDTNEAYRLATNWLSETGVDVSALEKKYRLKIEQWKYYPNGQGGDRTVSGTNRSFVMLPVYTVQWRGVLARANRKFPEAAMASVTISGPTKELIEYHVLDDGLTVDPAIQIKEKEKLLAIRDDEFLKYNSAQRSNLVVRFAGLTSSQPPALTPDAPHTSKKGE